MDASEGFEGRGGSTGGDGTRMAEQNSEALERLLAQVRETLDQTIEDRMDRFSGPRSEVVLNQVLTRLKDSQARGAWLMRAARRLTAFGATVWNSRAMRMLVP